MRHYLITVKQQKRRLNLQGAVQLLLKDTVKIKRIIHYVHFLGVHFFCIFTKTSFVFKNQNKFKVCYGLRIRQITYFKAMQTDMRCFGKERKITWLISRIQRYLLSLSHLSQKRGHFKPQRLRKIQIICTRREYIAQS